MASALRPRLIDVDQTTVVLSVWARGTGTIINGCSSQPRQFFWRRVSQHYPEYEADQ